MTDVLEGALTEVRAMLAKHHGGIDCISWDEARGELTLAFTGSCANCALSSVTLKQGVEVMLCERVPAIRVIHMVSKT